MALLWMQQVYDTWGTQPDKPCITWPGIASMRHGHIHGMYVPSRRYVTSDWCRQVNKVNLYRRTSHIPGWVGHIRAAIGIPAAGFFADDDSIHSEHSGSGFWPLEKRVPEK